MKKQLIIISLAAGVMLISGCGKKTNVAAPAGIPEGQQDNQQQNATSDNQPSDASINGNISDLIAKNQNLKCEVNYNDPEMLGTSTVYVSGGKSRIDATIQTSDGKEINSHTIVDGDWMYSWNDQTPKGTKMNLKEMPEPAQGDANAPQQPNKVGNEINQKVNYKCSQWSPDESYFAVPNDVEFTDFTEMMKQTQAQSQQMLQDNCKMCDNIPDETAKAQCKQSCPQ